MKNNGIVFTQDDSIKFTVSVLLLLNKKGFHVRSLQEALSVMDVITTDTTMCEIHHAMLTKGHSPTS